MRTLPGGQASQLLVLPLPALAVPMGQIVQLNCPVRLLYCPVGQLLQAMVSEVCSARLLYLPVPQSLQLVMSSSTADPYCPTGQASQAVALEKGGRLGCAMNVPGAQQPKRPVDFK